MPHRTARQIWLDVPNLRQARLEKQLAAKAAALRADSEAGCDGIVATNRRFEAEHLKGFEGGRVQGVELGPGPCRTAHLQVCCALPACGASCAVRTPPLFLGLVAAASAAPD
jgi:hypothetical protein